MKNIILIIFRRVAWNYLNSYLHICAFMYFSLRLTFCSLLFARYFLLVVCYFLLVARYFLLVTFCLLLFPRCSSFFRPKYYEIKLQWTAKKWFGYNETPPQIFSLHISEILVTFSRWWFSKFSQNAKPFSKLT